METTSQGSSNPNTKSEPSLATETIQPKLEGNENNQDSHIKEKNSLTTGDQELLRSILEEIHELNERQTYEPIKSQFLWTSLSQFLGIICAVVFGVFGVLTWKDGNKANESALIANQVALISFCQAEQSNATKGCDLVKTQGAILMRTLAKEFFRHSNESSSPSNPGGTNSKSSIDGILIGAVGGVGAVVTLIGTGMALPYQTYKEKVRRARGLAKKAGRSCQGGNLDAL